MDTRNANEVLAKFYELNKKGLLSDEEFAKLGKMICEGKTQNDEKNEQVEFEKRREDLVNQNRARSAELRENIKRREQQKAFEKDARADMLYLACLVDRKGERAYPIETLRTMSYYEAMSVATEIREHNPNAALRPLDKNEKASFKDLLGIAPDEEFDFDIIKNKPATDTSEKPLTKDDVQSALKNDAEKAEKLNQIRDELFKKRLEERNIESKKEETPAKTDDAKQSEDKKSEKAEEKVNVTTPKAATPDRSEEIKKISTFDGEKKPKDRTGAISNMATYQASNNLVTTPGARFVKGIKNVGSFAKNHKALVIAGAATIAAVAAIIANPTLLAMIPIGATGCYAAKQIYSGRTGK